MIYIYIIWETEKWETEKASGNDQLGLHMVRLPMMFPMGAKMLVSNEDMNDIMKSTWAVTYPALF